MNLTALTLTPLGNRSRTISHLDRLERAASTLSPDAALTTHRDLLLDPVTGDLVCHVTYDAYLQLVYNILTTQLGSNPYWPEMGWPLNQVLGQPLRYELLPGVASELRAALLRHPWTRDVQDMQLAIGSEGGGAPSLLRVTATVHPVQLPPLALQGVYA
jgi:phage baseplate assembly protein W